MWRSLDRTSRIPDTDPGASPRGMAVKFHLPGGSITDIVVNSFNGFPVATADELRDFFLALAATKPGDPQPTALDSFFRALIRPRKRSWKRQSPHRSVMQPCRISVSTPLSSPTRREPPRSVVTNSCRSAARNSSPMSSSRRRDQTILTTEIRERVRRGPIKFKLVVQMAERDDKLDDPSIAWPDSRKKVELGTITITKAVADSQTAEKKLDSSCRELCFPVSRRRSDDARVRRQ